MDDTSPSPSKLPVPSPIDSSSRDTALTTSDKRMVTAVVRVGTLMNRVPAKQYAMVLVSYFARNGWAPEEVEQAADGIETSADLLHMITLDGGLTPRPFVTWRESQNGKPDRRLYSRSEAIEDLDKHGSGVTLSDLYESVPGEDGKIRFRKK